MSRLKKQAIIYARLSSLKPAQERCQLVRDLFMLVVTAEDEGYHGRLEPAEIEKWLETIESEGKANRALADGDIAIYCDLGFQGSVGEDQRAGLRHLLQRVKQGKIGSIYVMGGADRLYRERVQCCGFMKLCHEHGCQAGTLGTRNQAIISTELMNQIEAALKIRSQAASRRSRIMWARRRRNDENKAG